MSFLEDVAAAVMKPGSRCTIAVVLEALDPTLADELRAAILDKAHYPASAISAALADRQIEIAETTINRHRRGSCKCPKRAA